MRIAELNMTHDGSTGNIMLAIADTARQRGHEVLTFSPRNYKRGERLHFPEISGHRYFSSPFENMLHLRLSQLTGLLGCFSYFGTKRLIRELDEFQPDVIHLHNLHKWAFHFPLLFGYIKRHNIPVVWTLHDCWAFTGHCPHFTAAKCSKWKSGCHHCPSCREYPVSFVDNSAYMYKLKKRWFTGIRNMTIITPSRWLAELVKQSYLKDYPVKVIHNGIDLSVFKPTESGFRERHGIAEDQYMLLGVAAGWGKRKGLDVFIELSRRMDGRFQIVLVGTDDALDKQLPENIISIHGTQDQRELAELYTAADLFVNPTREENYPTVNMEALACGTPVLTFRTGGSPEIPDDGCGGVVDCDDLDAMEREIVRICRERPYSKESCLRRARGFGRWDCFGEYVSLYESIESIS